MSEPQLGTTTDPKALIPGDPQSVESDADAMDQHGDLMEEVNCGLINVFIPSWEGAAAGAFWDGFQPEKAHWVLARDSFRAAGLALRIYADALRAAQGQAKKAIGLWAKGEWETAKATTAWTEHMLLDMTGELPSFAPDPGRELREEAEEVLADARAQLDEAAEELQSRLAGSSGTGDDAPSWLAKAAVAAAEHLDQIGHLEVGHPGPEFFRGKRVERSSDDEDDEPPGTSVELTLAEWGIDVEANLFEAGTDGETTLGDLTLRGSTEVKLGAEAGASLSITSTGLEAEAGGKAGLTVSADGSITVGDVEISAGGEGEVAAEASAEVSAGTDGVAAGTELKAGVSASAEGGVDVSGMNLGYSAEVDAGLGFDAGGSLQFDNGKLKVGYEVVAVFGLGGGGHGEIEIDPGALKDDTEGWLRSQLSDFGRAVTPGPN